MLCRKILIPMHCGITKKSLTSAEFPYPTDDMSYDDLVATAKALKDSGKLGDGVYPFACPVDFQTWYYQTVYANGRIYLK